jgi:hypothetical protein
VILRFCQPPKIRWREVACQAALLGTVVVPAMMGTSIVHGMSWVELYKSCVGASKAEVCSK